MKQNNLEQTIILRIEEAKVKTVTALYNEWRNAKTVDDREVVYSKIKVLDDLAYEFINNIKG